ncbi:MAG: FG-GAP-like repeat-containing protein [Bacteroidota bacterium]
MRVLLISILVVLFSHHVSAQVPVVTNIEPVKASPGSQLLITGSGFSATSSDLEVWFDNVRATITASSEFAIEVTVPVSARHGNVVVVNKLSGRSARSAAKFVPTYSGEAFDANKISLSKSFPGGTELFDVCTCDFNVDGKPDLIASKSVSPASDVLVLRNISTPPAGGSAGTIDFVPTNLNLFSPTFNLACGDLNGDGKPDLLASRGGATLNEVFVRLNTSAIGAANISFTTPSFPNDRLVLDVTDRAFRMVIRDLNGDGKPEVIVSNANTDKVYVFINTSTTATLSFNPTPVKFTVDGATNSYGIDVQDIDGDDKADIVVNQFNKPDVFILRNTSSGGQVTFATAFRIPLGGVTGTLNHLTTADFNNDGRLDIAVTNSTVNNKAYVVFNASTPGSFSFPSSTEIDVGDGPFGIDAGDIDGDGDVDIMIGDIDFTASPPNNEFSLLINGGGTNPTFTHQVVSTGATNKKSRNVRMADFDADGKPDLAFTTVGGNSLEVWRNANCFVPAVLNEAPFTICNGQTITLEAPANPGATYAWSEAAAPATVLGTSATFDITTAGTYNVTATSEGGTCVKSATAMTVTTNTSSVTQDPVIANATGGVITVCQGGTLQLNTIDTEPTYAWEGPAGFSSSNQNNTLNNITSDQAGFYTLQLQNGVCKSNVATVRVDVVNLASFTVTSNVSSNTLCQGSNLTLSTANQVGHTYQWIKDNADMAGQAANTLNVNQEGSYQVRVTNPQGCNIVTEALAVTVLASPVAAFNVVATACLNEEVTFTNASQVDTRGQVTYNWNFGDTQTTVAESPVHSYATAQAFTITLTVGYQNVATCSDSEIKSVNIVAPAELVITASDTGICPDEEVTLQIPTTFSSILWSTNQTTPAIAVPVAGTYSVEAQDANGCNAAASVSIAQKEVPVVTITTDPSPASIPPGLTIQLIASGADTYAWLPVETLDDPTLANPTATPLETTTYAVVGTLNDGCSAQASVTVEVEGELRITNVFSPNGDGVNDLWVIPGIQNYAECTLSLFDSQGRRILEQRGYQNDWDGTYDGKIVPKGTYYFVIAGCPDKTPLTGHVLVAY